ncbi:MAG TPA: 23S rRNA (pseudouridine(1915)-N(3))-methyltransferase RlmH [Dongiaceae bacterium]|jgi:23S rRNA (pseudouridine1915-N3)-methyltransferase|nr:23S rRNA (pseudouridine(1915)-N(3))-methyltransferase RlmH [Dongiaceae bacterium]
MRLVIAAVGRLKDGAERELFAKYRDRFEAAGKRLGMQPIVWHETVESRATVAAKRSAEEGAALLKLAREANFIIALDERGQMLSSEAFANLLAQVRDDGAKTAAILVGGADGLAPEVLAAARAKVSFGAITLPHQLARVILAEQLYRAATILAGHPYHRG